MLSFEQALEKLLAAAQPVAEIRSLPITAAAGRILAVSQQSTVAVPPLAPPCWSICLSARLLV